jgi:hypothetical protein
MITSIYVYVCVFNVLGKVDLREEEDNSKGLWLHFKHEVIIVWIKEMTVVLKKR